MAQVIGENNRLLGTVVEIGSGICKATVQDGSEVLAAPVNVSAAGEKTTLSIRPERVTIEPAAGSLPNIFAAKVEEMIYLGDSLRARLAVCGHNDFVVKLANVAGHRTLAEGDTVRVGWRAEDCHALDAS